MRRLRSLERGLILTVPRHHLNYLEPMHYLPAARVTLEISSLR